MRIAFVSREYAGVGSGGGIGTYVRNAAQMLASRGHDIEVFTEGQPAGTLFEGGIRVSVADCQAMRFAEAVVPQFEATHRANPFDVVETAEYGADAAIIFERFPEIARVVKLHTASFQLEAMNEAYLTFATKLRFMMGALRRGRFPSPFWGRYSAETDPERRMTLSADEISAPSAAILAWTGKVWEIDPGSLSVIPNVYVPTAPILDADPAGRKPLVTFVGKLETRKGVIELARAIPLILRARPETRFRFVGRVLLHPATAQPLDEVIMKLAGSAASAHIEFTGPVDYSKIAGHLTESSVAVFPSYWENYGYVCLEAMAAGCGVVASSTGGMAELITQNETGWLIPAKDPQAIAKAVIALLADPTMSAAMGGKARASVLDCYSNEAIGPLQEASYRRAILRAKMRSTYSVEAIAPLQEALQS